MEILDESLLKALNERPDYSLPNVVDENTTPSRVRKGRKKKRRGGGKASKGKRQGKKAVPAKQHSNGGLGSLQVVDEDAEHSYLQQDPKRMVAFVPGYRFEGGGLDDDELQEQATARRGPVIEGGWDLIDADNDYDFYKLSFCGKEHLNFVSERVPSTGDPMAISVIKTGEYYTGLVRSTKGNQRKEVLCSTAVEGPFDRLLRRGPSPKSILRSLCPELRDDLHAFDVYPSSDSRITELLLTLHERQHVTGFKFGVLYAARGQVRETDFFCNTRHSEMFDEFLDFLGDRIELTGWEGFRGGLDCRAGSTGKYGLYTEYNPGACPIMFHVSTFLPYDNHNAQQLERKRHIGNDLVVIVFQDSSDAPLRPSEISSRMIHVLVVVRPVRIKGETHYRVAVVTKQDVPAFGPPLENVALFKKGTQFREFLFQKLLNAERACYAAPILTGKMTKTRGVLLTDVIRQLK